MHIKFLLLTASALSLVLKTADAATTFLPDWQETGLNFENNEGDFNRDEPLCIEAVDQFGNKLYHKADSCPMPKVFDEYSAMHLVMVNILLVVTVLAHRELLSPTPVVAAVQPVMTVAIPAITLISLVAIRLLMKPVVLAELIPVGMVAAAIGLVVILVRSLIQNRVILLPAVIHQTAPIVRTAPTVRTVQIARTAPIVRTVQIARTAPIVRTVQIVQTAPIVRTARIAQIARTVASPEVVLLARVNLLAAATRKYHLLAKLVPVKRSIAAKQKHARLFHVLIPLSKQGAAGLVPLAPGDVLTARLIPVGTVATQNRHARDGQLQNVTQYMALIVLAVLLQTVAPSKPIAIVHTIVITTELDIAAIISGIFYS